MKTYSLEFEFGFDAYDDAARGYCSHVLVTIENGNTYRIEFDTPDNVQSELRQRLKIGEPCFYAVGLIIIPEITLEYMQKSVEFLVGQDYFESLQPIRKDDTPEISNLKFQI